MIILRNAIHLLARVYLYVYNLYSFWRIIRNRRNEKVESFCGFVVHFFYVHVVTHMELSIYNTINIELLKADMKSDCYGAFLGGGFGGALIEAHDIDCLSPDQIIELAIKKGMDLKQYVNS